MICAVPKHLTLTSRLLAAASKPFAIIVLLSLSAVAAAQQGNNANDEFRRQQEREQQLRQQLERRPDVRLESPAPPVAEGLLRNETPCFPITALQLEGDIDARFGWLSKHLDQAGDGSFDPALGSCLGSEGIARLVRRLQNALVAQGHVTTRLLVSPQDLRSGTLQLTLIPGRIRHIRFSGRPADAPLPAGLNALPAGPGDLLNLRDIEQALENFQRVPSVTADIQITPSADPDARPGDSDLLIQWQQPGPFRLNLAADDSGSKATGRYQSALTLSYDNPLASNDLFYLTLNRSQLTDRSERGTDGHAVHYSIPFGNWLLGLNHAQSRYHQTLAGLNEPIRYSGISETSDIKLARMLQRDATSKTSAWLRLWQRQSDNFTDQELMLAQRRRMAGWEGGASHRQFIGQSILESNLALRQGTGALGAEPAPEERPGGDHSGTAKSRLLTAESTFEAPLQLAAQTLRYRGNLRLQLNDTPLVPQDRLAIGGRYTVRGFDGESVLAAERGWLLRNDLGWMLGGGAQELYLALDHGEVAGRSAELLVGKRLTGSTLGLRGKLGGLTYDLFAGTPLAKPQGFRTPSTVGGFNLGWSF